MNVTSVWSSYGHHFLSTDSEEYDSCLTCGALYALVEGPGPGFLASHHYAANNGDEPQECSGDTGMEHGYEVDSNCNCALCA